MTSSIGNFGHNGVKRALAILLLSPDPSIYDILSKIYGGRKTKEGILVMRIHKRRLGNNGLVAEPSGIEHEIPVWWAGGL